MGFAKGLPNKWDFDKWDLTVSGSEVLVGFRGFKRERCKWDWTCVQGVSGIGKRGFGV